MEGQVGVLVDEAGQVHAPALRGAAAAVEQHRSHDPVGALAVLADPAAVLLQVVEQVAHLAQHLADGPLGRLAHLVAQLLGQLDRQVGEVVDEVERVLDLVGDAGRELAQRRQLLGLDELGLGRLQVAERRFEARVGGFELGVGRLHLARPFELGRLALVLGLSAAASAVALRCSASAVSARSSASRRSARSRSWRSSRARCQRSARTSANTASAAKPSSAHHVRHHGGRTIDLDAGHARRRSRRRRRSRPRPRRCSLPGGSVGKVASRVGPDLVASRRTPTQSGSGRCSRLGVREVEAGVLDRQVGLVGPERDPVGERGGHVQHAVARPASTGWPSTSTPVMTISGGFALRAASVCG